MASIKTRYREIDTYDLELEIRLGIDVRIMDLSLSQIELMNNIYDF